MKVWPNDAVATACAVDFAVITASWPDRVTVTLDGVVRSRSRPLRYQELSSLMNSLDSGARQASSSGPVLSSSVPRTRIEVSVPEDLLTTYRKSLPDTTISLSSSAVVSLPGAPGACRPAICVPPSGNCAMPTSLPRLSTARTVSQRSVLALKSGNVTVPGWSLPRCWATVRPLSCTCQRSSRSSVPVNWRSLTTVSWLSWKENRMGEWTAISSVVSGCGVRSAHTTPSTPPVPEP